MPTCSLLATCAGKASNLSCLCECILGCIAVIFISKLLFWFTHKNLLKLGERPYQCSYCPKAFRQETHLANHVRTHTGEKPFLCAVCGKAFNLKNNLSVHMKIHTGEKIQCETCGKTFRSFVKLKEHESAHLVAEEQPTHFSSMSDNLQCQK